MPYNNSALPGAYNDLQYANYTPVFQQRPVKELTELYKKKADDYTYVAEATNQLQRAVSTTPHLERDKAYLYEVANEVNTALEDFEQSGDLENKVFDTNKLVNNASKKLLALQQRKSNWDASVQDLMAKDKDGNLLKSVDDIKKGIYLLDKRTEDLEYDPVLDTYTGAIGSVNVPNKQNYAEKVAKILDDWKANKITLTDKNGNPLERLNNGYLKAGEVEYTDESELIRSAKSYLMNDPDFMGKVNFDLEYELDVLLSEDEGYRDMTFEDVQGRMSDDLKGVSEYYGFTGDKPIKEQLAEKDVSP